MKAREHLFILVLYPVSTCIHAAVSLAPTVPAPGPGMLLCPDPLSCSYQFSIEADLGFTQGEEKEAFCAQAQKPGPAVQPFPM